MVTPDGGESPQRLTAFLRGSVQGVGMRWWVRSGGLALGLVGRATNLADGRVEVVAEGPPAALRALLGRLRGTAVPGRPGHVDGVTAQWSGARGGFEGFGEA